MFNTLPEIRIGIEIHMNAMSAYIFGIIFKMNTMPAEMDRITRICVRV